jgi:methanogenic corrinoid protein MtbC1
MFSTRSFFPLLQLKWKGVIDALGKASLRDKVKVMVGGAPVSLAFARQIEADGYAADANGAVEVAKGLLAMK